MPAPMPAAPDPEQTAAHPRLARRAVLLLLAGAVVAPVSAADWPVWRGPAHTGISTEQGWTTNWPAGGPRKLWQANVGTGYSTISVAGGRAYTMGQQGAQDTVVCMDAESGKPLWRHSYRTPPRHYPSDPNPDGTTSTPIVEGDRVYVLSREGLALCLAAANGKPVWQRDLRRELNAALPTWGFAGSPLVYGNSVIYNVGTSGVAVDRATGRVLWKSGRDVAGYATPVAYTIGGQKGIALFGARALYGVDPGNGRVLWSHPWQTAVDVNAADPLVNGDTIFITSGYNHGCALLRIAGGRPRVVWENRNLRSQFNSGVIVNGYVYGNDQNTLKCLDLKDGSEKWQHRGIGNGGLIAADGKLIVLADRGELFVAPASPGRFQELARARVLGGTSWAHPVLANGRLYCRNNAGDLACYDLRGK